MQIKCPKNIIFNVVETTTPYTCPKTCARPEQCKRAYFTPIIVEEIKTTYNSQPNQFLTNNAVPAINSQSVKIIANGNSSLNNSQPQQNANANNDAQIINQSPSSSRDFRRNRLGASVINEEQQSNDEIEQLRKCNGIIIYIGSKNYRANEADVESALIEIFIHWNVGVVFENEHKFKTSFENVLKFKYGNNYKKIKEDILDNNNSNLNSKFYQLFYKHIYIGKPICHSFYYANGYKQNTLNPILQNQNDLFELINSRHDYLNRLIDCQNELLDFLHTDLDSLLRLAVIYIYEHYKKIGFFKKSFNETGKEYYNYVVIDSSGDNFINNLYKVDTLEKMNNKIEFLKQYKVLKTGQIIKRNEIFNVQDVVGDIDDNVYQLLGITVYNSSQCKDVLKVYLNLLNEYITIKTPEQIDFSCLKLTVNNFYKEVLDIIHKAYSKCLYNYANDVDIQKIYLLLVLKNNHILDYFVDQCRTDKINVLLDLIKPNIKFKDYFDSSINEKYVFFEGNLCSLKVYFEKIILINDIEQVADIIGNDAIFKILENEINSKDLQHIETRIQDLVKQV